MHKFNAKLMATAALAAVLAVACGGDDHVTAAPADPAAEAGQSVQKTIDFLNSLLAATSDSSDPANIDAVTLATDDTTEATAL